MKEVALQCRTEFRHLEMNESGYVDSPVPLGPFVPGEQVTVQLGDVQGTFFVVSSHHTIRGIINGASQETLVEVSDENPFEEE